MEEIIHGLDLPDEISERNNKIVMKSLGITEEEMDLILRMTDEEFEKYIEESREKEKNKEQKYWFPILCPKKQGLFVCLAVLTKLMESGIIFMANNRLPYGLCLQNGG